MKYVTVQARRVLPLFDGYILVPWPGWRVVKTVRLLVKLVTGHLRYRSFVCKLCLAWVILTKSLKTATVLFFAHKDFFMCRDQPRSLMYKRLYPPLHDSSKIINTKLTKYHTFTSSGGRALKLYFPTSQCCGSIFVEANQNHLS